MFVEVGQLIKNPESIPDAALRAAVTDAIDADPFYGPSVDMVRPRQISRQFSRQFSTPPDHICDSKPSPRGIIAE